MCPATLSNKAGKWLHAVPHALPCPRGFISLAEQQQLETANQHAVSKGRLRWQLRARVTLSACCHLVIILTARRTTSQHACQQTLAPSHSYSDTQKGEESWIDPQNTHTHTHPNPCMMFFSMITPPTALFFFPLPPSAKEKKVKTTTNKPRGSVLSAECCCLHEFAGGCS